MNLLIKTLVSAAGLALFTGSAIAQQTFEASFTYDPDAPPQDIYATLKQTAHQACRKEYFAIKSFHYIAKAHLVERCERDLLDRVVTQIGNPVVIALHAGVPLRYAEIQER